MWAAKFKNAHILKWQFLKKQMDILLSMRCTDVKLFQELLAKLFILLYFWLGCFFCHAGHAGLHGNQTIHEVIHCLPELLQWVTVFVQSPPLAGQSETSTTKATYTHTNTNITQTQTHTHTHTDTHTNMCTHTNTHTHTDANTHTYRHTCTHTTHTNMCTHTHTCTHTHIHNYSHTLSLGDAFWNIPLSISNGRNLINNPMDKRHLL